jgi:glycosyltransferase involved in cell wall biosynthesis
MKYYKKLIAVSESVKKDVEARSENKCEIIYNGINLSSVKQRESVYNSDEFRIISVGRLDHLVKGQDLLIEAARILVVKKGVNKVKFFLTGEGSSKEYLKELIFRFNLEANVFFLGNRSREWIYDNLQNYDLFVQPSRMEGFGLSVTEAMAARVPVVASDIEGPAEILESGKHGLLFENNKSEDLVLQIEKAMKMYETGEILKLTVSAYEHCMNDFNIAKITKEYCVAYSEL